MTTPSVCKHPTSLSDSIREQEKAPPLPLPPTSSPFFVPRDLDTRLICFSQTKMADEELEESPGQETDRRVFLPSFS